MSKPKYDSTVARIAGNIIGHLLYKESSEAAGRDGGTGSWAWRPSEDNVRDAVAAARAIVAEVKRTELAEPAHE